jgi:hypothetical protein
VLFELLVEILVQVVFEFVAAIVQAAFQHLVDVDFAGNRGRLSGNVLARLGWYAVAGAAAGGASAALHPAPLSMSLAARVAGLVAMPIASGLALAGWDVGRGRGATGAAAPPSGRGPRSAWATSPYGSWWCGWCGAGCTLPDREGDRARSASPTRRASAAA